jgi:hypothetical protein
MHPVTGSSSSELPKILEKKKQTDRSRKLHEEKKRRERRLTCYMCYIHITCVTYYSHVTRYDWRATISDATVWSDFK